MLNLELEPVLSQPLSCRVNEAPAGWREPAQPLPTPSEEVAPGRVPAPASRRPWVARGPRDHQCVAQHPLRGPPCLRLGGVALSLPGQGRTPPHRGGQLSQALCVRLNS